MAVIDCRLRLWDRIARILILTLIRIFFLIPLDRSYPVEII